MRLFIKVVKLNLKIMIQYKWGFFIYTVMRPIGILINISLFTSIYTYNNANSIKGYSLQQMVWYFIASSFIWIFIWNFTDYRISERILSGDLTMDLLRPVSLFRFELANAIALRTVGVLMEFVPGFFIYSLIFFPSFLTLQAIIKFIIVAVFAFTIFYLLNFLIGLLAFVFKSNNSLSVLKGLIISLTSGSAIPMEFYPDWLNRIFEFLPFKYIFYWPVQVFLNKGSSDIFMFLRIISVQLFWILIMYLISRLSWSSAVKRFCAVGG